MKLKRDIQVDIWNESTIKGLTFSKTEYSKFSFEKHFHNYYKIILIEQGINSGFTEKNKYQIGPRTVIIINPSELHAGNSAYEKKLRFRSISFEREFLNTITKKLELPFYNDIYFKNTPINDVRLTTAVQNLFFCSENNVPKFIIEIVTSELFSILFKEHLNDFKFKSYNENNKNHVLKALNFIRESYNQNLTLKQISEHSGISQYHLLREFKKTYNQTPFQFLRNYRIEKSKSFLKNNTPISEVALDIGFFDHSHFIKCFIKNEGILPSKFKTFYIT